MKNLTFLFLLFLPLTVYQQGLKKDNQLFKIADEMPIFKGDGKGISLSEYLQENTKCPDSLIINNVSGMVFVGFVVDSLGQIRDIKVLRGFCKIADDEAIRVVKSTQNNWYPGKYKEKPVPVSMTVPIKFNCKKPEKVKPK